MKTKNEKFMSPELADGAMLGLAMGAQMDFIPSVIELIDNAEDYNASEVNITIKNNGDCGRLTVLSKEKHDCDDPKKVFTLGCSCKTKTKKGGVGKYNQGAKYASSALIGEGNKGEVTFASRPVNGRNWAAKWTMDFSNSEQYTDKHIEILPDCVMPIGYDFMVDIKGCPIIKDSDILKLQVFVGVRYNEKIKNGDTKIIINGVEIDGQDRLYSQFKYRVDYHEKEYFRWRGDDKAIAIEWSDLRFPEYINRDFFTEDDYIMYDMSLGLSGRPKGVKVTKRSGIEVCVNGITVIQEDMDKVAASLLNIDTQPSSSGWRARVSIYNNELADLYLRGGNKSNVVMLPEINDDPELQPLIEKLKAGYDEMMKRYHALDKDCHSIKKVDNWCTIHNIDTKFLFGGLNPNYVTFQKKNNDNSTVIINFSKPLFKGFGTDDAKALYFIAMIQGCGGYSTDEIINHLDKFESMLKTDDILKN